MFKGLLRRGGRSAEPRDTDADWEEIGRSNPYFGVLTDPRYKTANLNGQALAAFFASGEADISWASEVQKRRYPDFAPGSALDFGCGVGRLTRALAAATGDAFGVDVSEAMLAEAADRAGAEANALAASIVGSVPSDQALQALIQVYLSKEHLSNIETGCPNSALCSEMPRQSPEVRLAATRRIKEMVDLIARQFPDWGQPSAHERALVTMATLVGTLVLARAVDDPALSDAWCSATLKSLACDKAQGEG